MSSMVLVEIETTYCNSEGLGDRDSRIRHEKEGNCSHVIFPATLPYHILYSTIQLV